MTALKIHITISQMLASKPVSGHAVQHRKRQIDDPLHHVITPLDLKHGQITLKTAEPSAFVRIRGCETG